MYILHLIVEYLENKAGIYDFHLDSWSSGFQPGFHVITIFQSQRDYKDSTFMF